MANIYSAKTSRTTAVFVGIVILHLGFFWALKQGLVRAGLQLVQDFSIMDLPPPLIELPDFAPSQTQITVQRQETPRPQAPTPPRQAQVTPPRIKAKGDRI